MTKVNLEPFETMEAALPQKMKRIANWVIYLADAMCVLSALLIAGAYFNAGVPMGLSVVMLCAFMVLSAAAIICTAQILSFKYAKLAKEKSGGVALNANIEENFQVLFKQVSAIKRDNATLNANFTALLNRFNAVDKKGEASPETEHLLTDVKALKSKLEELELNSLSEADITALKLEIEENMESLKADVEIDLGKLEDIDNAVKDLKQTIEDLGSNIEVEAIEENLEAEYEEDETELDDEAEDTEDFDEESESPAEDFDDVEDAFEQIAQAANTQEIEEEETELEAQESEYFEISFEESQGADDDFQNDIEDTQDIEEFEEVLEEIQEAEIEHIEDLDEDFEDEFDDDEDIYEPKSQGLDDDGVDPSDDLSQISLMSRALNNTQQAHSVLGSFAKANKVAQKGKTLANEAPQNIDADLSDDIDDDLNDILNLASEIPQKPASITINAMLGLGNKPYIRGIAPELSQSEGVQMDFVEIGKWRYTFKNLNEQTKISIWLNDESISDNGEIIIDKNEQLEINANFS